MSITTGTVNVCWGKSAFLGWIVRTGSATKVNPRISGRLDREAAYRQVTESLKRLRLPSVDTVYLHFPDPATPVTGVLEAMADLHDQGKYRELGLSNFPAWMVADVWHLCQQKRMGLADGI